jgi:hypothetical protein
MPTLVIEKKSTREQSISYNVFCDTCNVTVFGAGPHPIGSSAADFGRKICEGHQIFHGHENPTHQVWLLKTERNIPVSHPKVPSLYVEVEDDGA